MEHELRRKRNSINRLARSGPPDVGPTGFVLPLEGGIMAT